MSETSGGRAPNAQFATLIGVTRTYCHPEAYEDAYEALKRLARRENDPEMIVFKEELRDGLTSPDELPRAELSQAVQYDDGSADAFLRRLWRDLYPDEPVPGRK
jgi:hypothetical protein